MKLLLSNILYNLILTLFRFSVRFTVKSNHNADLTLFHLKVSDTGIRFNQMRVSISNLWLNCEHVFFLKILLCFLFRSQ